MRLLAIDGDSVLRQAWEGTPDDQRTGVWRRVVNRVTGSIASWDRVIVAWDGGLGGGIGGFRKARVDSYKANRSDPGAAYRDQRTRAIEALRAEKCTVIVGPEIDVDGAIGVSEADDVLAWVEREYSSMAGEDSELRLVSNDGDIETLACDIPRVEILKPASTRDDLVWNVDRIRTARGVEPKDIPQLKALKGDPSDNYPGFPGIGDKCAAMLIQKYGSAVDAVANAPSDDSIPAKELKANQRESLKAGGIELAAQGVWLATLRGELPLDFDALVMNPEPPAEKPKAYFDEKKAPPTQPEPPPTAPPDQVPQTQAIELRKNTEVLAVAAPSGINPFSLQPGRLDAMYDLSLALHRSGLYAHLTSPEAIMAVILDANERGVPAATACRNAYVVPGSGTRPPKLGWSAAYIAGLVLASGKADFFELVPEKCNGIQATVRFKRRGRPEGEHTFTFEEAKRCGYLERAGVWQKDTKAMLRAATLRTAARAYFPDVVSGVYMPDEIRSRESDTDADSEAANV
jgi:5'-3' exonuclease